MGNEGGGGLQTTANPAISAGAMAIASADNTYTLQYLITAPNGHRIPYDIGSQFGQWNSTFNATIVVNSLFTLHSLCRITFQ